MFYCYYEYKEGGISPPNAAIPRQQQIATPYGLAMKYKKEERMTENDRKQSPIFTKTSDFLLWLLQHTEKFPKSERFRLAKRMEDCAFGFYELLVEATRSSKRKRQFLLQADVQLEKLRLYVRMSQARKLTSLSQYHFASGALVEIGKLLGGWLKTIPET